MEQVKGIEPSSSAWEADVLPLYHARETDGTILYLLFANVQHKSHGLFFRCFFIFSGLHL